MFEVIVPLNVELLIVNIASYSSRFRSSKNVIVKMLDAHEV